MKQTPSQTIGPYFAYGLTPRQYEYDHSEVCGNDLTDPAAIEEKIHLTGQIMDAEGNTVNDAMIEIWQANPNGNYNDPDFKGFGRCGTGTDPLCHFNFYTIKPGRVDGMAPHINVIVFMRGLLSHLYTRVYFPDEQEANDTDPVLRSVPEARRQSLIATRELIKGMTTYRFNIQMRGPEETVFFDV